MMRIATMLCLMLASVSDAGSWMGIYRLNGQERGAAVAAMPDNGLVLGALSSSINPETYTWLLKVDPFSAIVWQRRWSDSGSLALAPGLDGSVWGFQGKYGESAGVLFRFDQDGDLLSSEALRFDPPRDPPIANRLVALSDGFLLLGDRFYLPGHFAMAVRFDTDGGVRWAREYVNIGLNDAVIGPDGELWAAGWRYRDAFLLRLSDEDGSVEASYQFVERSVGGCSFQALGMLTDGTLLAVGTGQNNEYNWVSWVIQLDREGGILGCRSYDTHLQGLGFIHPDGYAVLGFNFPYWERSDQAFLAVSPEKGVLWSSRYHNGMDEYYVGQLAMNAHDQIVYSATWSFVGDDRPTSFLSAGRLERDGTVPGCGYESYPVEEYKDLAFEVESVAVSSAPITVTPTPTPMEYSEASGTADICRSTGNHRRPLGPP